MAKRKPSPPESAEALHALALDWANEPPSPALASCIRKTQASLFSSTLSIDGREQGFVEILDGSSHGLILLAVLTERCREMGATDPGFLMTAILRFSQSVSSITLCLLPEHTKSLARQIPELSKKLGSLALALEPLSNLVQRYLPPGILTPVHKELLRVSVVVRNFKYAKPLLDVDIWDVDMRSAPITYLDHLTYHYLAGIIASLMKDYQRSAQLFETTVSAPGNCVSAIQVEAYKKLILVQLLCFGQSKKLPKYTYVDLIQAGKHHVKPYMDFALAFDGAKMTNEKGIKVKQIAEMYRDLFIKDRNWGLITQCIVSLSKRTIVSLSQVYSALPLSTLATHLGLSQPTTTESIQCTADFITRLRSTSPDIFIKLDVEKQLVILNHQEVEEPLGHHDDDTLKQLGKASKSLHEWQHEVQGMIRQVEQNREYLSKVIKEIKEGGLITSTMTTSATFGVLIDEDLDQNTGWEDDYGK